MHKYISMVRRCFVGFAALVLLALADMPSASAQSAACGQIKRYHQTASAAAAGYNNESSRVETQIENARQRLGHLRLPSDILIAVAAQQTIKEGNRELRRLKRKAHNSFVIMKKLERRWHRLGCDIPAERARNVQRQLPPDSAPPMDAATAIGIMGTMIGIVGGLGRGGGRVAPQGGVGCHHCGQ
jgi:hypothetical protein